MGIENSPAKTAKSKINETDSLLKSGVLILGFLLAFTALDRASSFLETYPGINPWYLPTGLSLALLITFGPRYAPAVFLAVMAAIVPSSCCQAYPLSWIVLPLIIAVEYGLAAYLIRLLLGNDLFLTRQESIGRFILVGLGASLAVSISYVTVMTGMGLIPAPDFIQAALNYWMGDATGIMLLTPLALIYAVPPINFWLESAPGNISIPSEKRAGMKSRPVRRSIINIALQAGFILLTLWLGFGSPLSSRYHLFYLCFLPLIWIAVKEGLKTTAIWSLVINIGVIFFYNYFNFLSIGLADLQILMLALSLTGLVLGSAVSQQRQVEAELRKSEERTRISEELYRTVVTTMSEGIVLQDDEGKVTTCNRSAESILGRSADQIIGHTLTESLENAVREDGSPFPAAAHPSTVTLQSAEPFSNVVMGIRRHENKLTWISFNTRPLCRPGSTRPYAVLSSFTDITDQIEAYQLLEQRVEERTRELSAVLEVSRDVASTLELKPLLSLILQQLKLVVDYSDAGIGRLEGDEFVIVEHQGLVPREKMLQFRASIRADTGYGRVAQSLKPVIIPEIWSPEPWLEAMQSQTDSELKATFGSIHSWMAVPLIVRDQLIGILRVDHVEPNHFSPGDANLVMAFANQAAVAIENARLYEDAQGLAALEERQKLARELHDSVSQALYGIALGARTARTLLDRDASKAAEPIEYCLSLAEAGMTEMRALIFELRPDSLENEGIIAALTKQVSAFRARHSLQVEAVLCDEPQVSMPVKEALYRITLEALQNVIKHSHAERVELKLEQAYGKVILEIRDFGQGFDPTSPHPGHLGLNTMRERAERAGGVLSIHSQPAEGTTIRVEIPMPV